MLSFYFSKSFKLIPCSFNHSSIYHVPTYVSAHSMNIYYVPCTEPGAKATIFQTMEYYPAIGRNELSSHEKA